MDWDARIFRYCERGGDAGFWAEPLNAATNGAFLIAAGLALRQLLQNRGKRPLAPEFALVGLIFAMGIGSFLFHTYATRWASFADTGPIGVFMLAYLCYALRRFLHLNWILTGLLLAGFMGTLSYAGSIKCDVGIAGGAGGAPGACLNGTAGYVPAWMALVAVTAFACAKHHPAWRLLAGGSAVLFISLVIRTVDWEFCHETLMAGHRLGTHFLWHVLNATMLYLLALAAIRHGAARR